MVTSTPASEGRAHPGWVRGTTRRAPGELVLHLREAAEHRARRALRLYRSHDPMGRLDAGADAGGAIELLAKACVATIEPAALAKPQGAGLASSILRLRGHDLWELDGRSGLATIDATEALRLAELLFHLPKAVVDAARTALAVRNDSLHMGIAEPARVDEAVAAMARFVREVLVVLDVSGPAFWGASTWEVAADTAIEERAAVVTDDATRKLTDARARYERYVLRVGAEEARAMAREHDRVEDYRHKEHLFDLSMQTHRCPACGNFGGAYLNADGDAEPDGDGGFTYITTAVWVDRFECPHCQLRLTGQECESVGILAPVMEPPEEDRDEG